MNLSLGVLKMREDRGFFSDFAWSELNDGNSSSNEEMYLCEMAVISHDTWMCYCTLTCMGSTAVLKLVHLVVATSKDNNFHF